jgi:hypothetical protein
MDGGGRSTEIIVSVTRSEFHRNSHHFAGLIPDVAARVDI